MDTTLNYRTFENPEWGLQVFCMSFFSRKRKLDVGFVLDFVDTEEKVP
jgi:hypothetical protein